MTDRPLAVFAQRPMPETVQRLGDGIAVCCNTTDAAWPPERLREAAAGADALVAFMTERVDAALLDACPRLRIVAGALKGYDNLDVDACTARGVWVTTVPDLLTVPTAELALGLMIGLGRHLREADAHVRSGAFTGWGPRLYGTGLAGSVVGIIGMGAIGRAIARRVRAFDAEVVYADPQPLDAADPLTPGCERLPLDELLHRSRFVVLAAPLTAATLHLIDRERLALMRPDALLVNPGRGSVADEAAVAEALDTGRLGGYAADVFEMEDLSRADRPAAIPGALLRHPRTLFAPHLGSAVTGTRRAIEAHAADNVRRVLAGHAPADAINDPRGHGC
ncbi:Phosphonate dehydrogenase [wastewater metagenome]|uniref:Phosphonate dehydrogenase n=3 Tax=root TaxID=1 RepID=A0A5B8RAX5_9ZZZZ|nr:phosphonate dehydrogenase [uncultured organism]